MRDGIHPEYRPVVFRDAGSGQSFVIRSTVKTRETVEFNGEKMPLVNLDVSHLSHPFYTGKTRVADTGGRIDKFKKRYGGK
jgi:large subunit ribosomal protein L31